MAPPPAVPLPGSTALGRVCPWRFPACHLLEKTTLSMNHSQASANLLRKALRWKPDGAGACRNPQAPRVGVGREEQDLAVTSRLPFVVQPVSGFEDTEATAFCPLSC